MRFVWFVGFGCCLIRLIVLLLVTSFSFVVLLDYVCGGVLRHGCWIWLFAFLYLRLIACLGVGCIVGLWFVDLDLVVGLVVLPISGCRGVGWLEAGW